MSETRSYKAQKLVERLEAKGCVHRDRSDRAHRFRPLVSHERYLHSRLQALADRLCDGATIPLVTTLLRPERISPREREQLRNLIEALGLSMQRGNPRGD